jgi:hypothetical protein
LPQGRLNVVGTGYLIAGQVTPQALACMRRAEKLFYLVPDPVTGAWIEDLNPSAESLANAYGTDKDRRDSYREMVERMLAPVRRGLEVCGAFYGHPGVVAFPTHEAVRQARSEGFEAWMFPGVSAADCLFADLGIDPTTAGCQMYEASAFLYHRRRFDRTCLLILWQVGMIGISTHPAAPCSPEVLRVLVEVLVRHYPRGHEVVVYEAAQLPVCRPRVLRVALDDLPAAEVSGFSTLLVPPWGTAKYDWVTVERLAPFQIGPSSGREHVPERHPFLGRAVAGSGEDGGLLEGP